MCLPIALAAVVIPLAGAKADTLTGQVSVIDGDSIEIQGERIRILDIDAPENAQLCFRKTKTIDEGAWHCGRQAASALSDWIGTQTVTCETTRRGPRKGLLARCVLDGRDVGEWLAANGWAVPYLRCKCEIVRDASNQAKASELGIWSSNFTMPWDWRKSH